MDRPGTTRRNAFMQIAAAAGFAKGSAASTYAKQSDQVRSSAGGFKIGVVDWELTKPGDPGAIAVAARLGFDGIQTDLGDVESMRDPVRQKEYQSLARKQNVQIASLALGILSEIPYAQDPKAQALVDIAIDIAKAMNQRVLLLAFFEKGDLNRPENRLDMLVGRLKENAPKAEREGVVLGLEAEISVERYKEIIDRVNSPAVKVYFDMVHAHGPNRDIYQEITFLADRICEFHAKDYGNILFGRGKVDFREVRRAMDAIGYRGWIQVEQWSEIKGDKPLGFDETQRTNLSYLRGIFPK